MEEYLPGVYKAKSLDQSILLLPIVQGRVAIGHTYLETNHMLDNQG